MKIKRLSHLQYIESQKYISQMKKCINIEFESSVYLMVNSAVECSITYVIRIVLLRSDGERKLFLKF